jgi:hypothetical protein
MQATATRERPILFRGEMVRAILDGRKTMTRRIVKGEWFYDGETGEGASWEPPTCPYGQVGDRLWVRETFSEPFPLDVEHENFTGFFRATDPDRKVKWKPSIFMPRWACRLVLEIADIRVERLNDISEEDAIAEGFDVDLCESILRRKAGKKSMKFSRWLELPNGDEPEGYWCVDCVGREARKQKARVCGWNDSYESDHAPTCSVCGHLLHHSLTRYGIETELDLTDEDSIRIEYTPADSHKALILAELASGMGDWSDEYAGRLAQIGFGTLWESINGVGSWAANPRVWIIEFKPVELEAKRCS